MQRSQWFGAKKLISKWKLGQRPTPGASKGGSTATSGGDIIDLGQHITQDRDCERHH